MNLVHYTFPIIVGGEFKAGLKPTWRKFKQYDNGADMSKYAPPINDRGDGYYGFAWDAKRGNEVIGDITIGELVPDGGPIVFSSTREAGITLAIGYPADTTTTTV